MSESYLIAHKVRGEPAFDVAARMECPLCAGHGHDLDGVCHECDSTGFWWIVPTSGHRAYPYWNVALVNIDDTYELNLNLWMDLGSDNDFWPPQMPLGLPDHYPTSASPNKPKIDLTALLPKAPPIRRRV